MLEEAKALEHALAEESADLDGYFSDAPLHPEPIYPDVDQNFDNVVVITSLPKVSQTKVEKLTKVIMKKVSAIGTLKTNDSSSYNGFYMPFGEKTTLGLAFVEFTSALEAKRAVEILQGSSLGKNHSLVVTPYKRAQALADISSNSEFEEPSPAPFVEKPNTSHWLEDTLQRDQFLVRHSKETMVHWSDGKQNPPTLDYDGAREKQAGVVWCENYAFWSPLGNYLATLVPAKGVILWAGPEYKKVGRFPAPGVEYILFSPRENYLLTSNHRRDDPNAIKVFQISSGKLLRAFPLYPAGFVDAKNTNKEDIGPPPPFSWSHDDSYLARMGKDLISIFETPSMKLLDRRSLSTNGIHEFQWSPKANVLAYWAPEVNNAPAHVDLIEIPSRNKLRQKNLFNVSKCTMVWQNEGRYLGVKVTRHTKSKKTLYNNIELFRLHEPGIPVEMLDIRDAVMAFAWEPRGSRFAMIHAENPSSTKVNVSFYDMMKKVEAKNTSKKGKQSSSSQQPHYVSELNKVHAFEGKQCNHIFWSPAGQHIIMASLGDSASGTLEFYDVETKTLAMKEHYRANQVVWDPSGRSVASVVSQPIGGGHFKFAMDNGYMLWSFQGKQLYQQSHETFYQLLWRPRERLLTKQEETKVIKNIKKYERQFDKADKDRQRALHLEETKGKRADRAKFRETLGRLDTFYNKQKEDRMALLGGYDSDDDSNYVFKEVVTETILSTKEEVVY